MSWDLALPYGGEKEKEVSGRYKVRGIPSLIILDAATGEVVNSAAVQAVAADTEGTNFPWKPRSALEILHSAKYVDKEGNTFDKQYLRTLDYIVLYFSAHWCPPCRQFTPEFAKWYTSHFANINASADKAFDVFFISSDRDDKSFNEYLDEMPWKALSFKDRATKTALSETFEIEGIPSLIVIDKHGNIVQKSARSKVSTDPEGFPWSPQLISRLDDAVDVLNDVPSFILLTDKLTNALNEVTVTEAFKAAANPYSPGKNAAPSDKSFSIGGDGDDAVDSIRKFLKLLGDQDGDTAVRIAYIEIPKQRKALMTIKDGVLPTEADISTFFKNCLNGVGCVPLK